MTDEKALGPRHALDMERRHAGITTLELWLRYVGLGGAADLSTLTDYLGQSDELPRSEHNTLVVALNERFSDLGLNHPVLYRD